MFLFAILSFFFASAITLQPEGVPSRVKDLEVEPVVWRNVGPGGGGWIQSLCLSRWDGNLMYAGCDVGGFYISYDAGKTWETRNSGLNDFYVESIAEHPEDKNTIFIGTRSGVYVTHNQGRRWTHCSVGFPDISKSYSKYTSPISKVVFSPKTPSTIYAAIGQPRECKGGQGQICVTRDSGKTWANLIKNGVLPPSANIRDIVVNFADEKRILICTDEGLFLSCDGGISWKPSNTGLPSHLRTRQLASCPGAPSVIYVTLQQKGGEEKWSAGVYRSDDGGETWQARNNGFRQISGKPGFNNMCSTWTDKIVVHPDNPDIVYVGGAAWWETGIYKTVDGGLNWSRILTKSKEGWIDFWGQVVTCLSLSPASPNALAFGTSGMVFRSDDGGSSWHSRYSEVLDDGRIKGTGLEVTCLHSITPDKTRKGRFFLGYYDIGLLITDDNGKTFRRSMNGIPKKFINSCFSIVQAPDNPLCLWGGFGSWGGSGSGIVAKSIDGGKSWTPCTKDGNGWVNSQPRNIVSFGGNGVYRIVYTSRKGLISSDNGGESWAINTNLVFGAMTRDGDTLYAAKNGGNKTSTLWKSVDEGRTWSIMPATTVLKVGEIKAIAVKDNQILFSARRNRIGSDSGGAWYSSDGGVTFTKVVEDYFCQGVLITQDAILVSMIDHPYHNFPGGGGIRISRDKGKTWKSLNTSTLQNRNISSLVLDPFTPNSIWAGSGGNSIFITTLLPVQ